jgi:hypothetical protein
MVEKRLFGGSVGLPGCCFDPRPRAGGSACQWSVTTITKTLNHTLPSTDQTPGAVDMDIYGAFQFCSIAILAAPLTVRLSKTYFYDPGRNIIFIWTAILLAGLVCTRTLFLK